MGQLIEALLSSSGWAAVALLFMLPALEAPAFLGLVLPGELALLLRGGGWALVVGRCTAGARVVLPGLAGMLGLRYRVFVLWTGMAATLWAAAHVLLGYAAGAGWRHIHQLAGRVGLALVLAVVVALAVTWLVRRPARRHQDEPGQPVASGRRRD
jgi:membrane protein DedA with SNARE-associated domain